MMRFFCVPKKGRVNMKENSRLSKLIGTKSFYKMVLRVAVPIMIQNGITNFVSMLDNIMVGQIGTEQMSGVAIVNQLMQVFNVCIFGAISGAGIFGAQYFGKGNMEGVRDAFRFKVWISSLFTLIGILIFWCAGSDLITMYLHDGSDVGDVGRALYYGQQYLNVMMIGMIPFAISQMYASTLRECGETVVPMKAGIAAVAVNMCFNYILIFGKLGAPALGVQGAAIATLISRFVECAVIVGWTHRHKDKNPFAAGLYRTLKIPRSLAVQIIKKGSPLIINEALWSSGMAFMVQCYSVRGLSVVAALNISTTVSNVFNVVFLAMGNSVAILVGQLLGAGKLKEAKETDTKLIFAAVMSCVVIGAFMAMIAPLFPHIYNTSDEVKELARNLILISACCMPMAGFYHVAYFTMRSGGKTFITFLFDSGYVWIISIPLAYVLSRYTELPMVWLYLCCQMADVAKCVIGFIMVKKGVWIQQLTV